MLTCFALVGFLRFRVNGNLNLSRAIGDLKYKGNTELPPKDQIITAQPDVRKISLTHEDRFFILACDGVWDVMSNQVWLGLHTSCSCAQLLNEACFATISATCPARLIKIPD